MSALERFVDDRPSAGILSLHSDAFADPGLLELEMKHIFERTWTFLGLESQIAAPHDFITTWIGRVPVLVARGAEGRVAAFLNVCRHKGAQLCRSESGNRRVHACVYHAWAYDSSGRNVNIKHREAGCYPAAFDALDHDLLPLARLGIYRGMIFGSLNADVPPLEDYLGEFRTWLDLTLDQGTQGMEFVPGRSAYTFAGNWKLQLDNGMDTYHLTTTHVTYMNVLTRRHTEQAAGNQAAKQFDWRRRLSQDGGSFGFDYGHAGYWLNQAQPENRAIYPRIAEVASRIGETKAQWVLRPRQALFFPNMQIADSSATLLRTFRPLAPDLTEMRVYCLAPVGEPAATRALRIRQFEDFFSASGFATPDDTVTYEECQRGLSARPGWMQGYLRGASAVGAGPNAEAKEVGMKPAHSMTGPFDIQGEVVHHPAIREWARLLQAGLDGLSPYSNAADRKP